MSLSHIARQSLLVGMTLNWGEAKKKPRGQLLFNRIFIESTNELGVALLKCHRDFLTCRLDVMEPFFVDSMGCYGPIFLLIE